MELEGQGKIMRIFIGEEDKYNHQPLYHVILKLLKEKGFAGGTVIKGIEGFGANSRIHTSRILSLSDDLPILIEVVDKEERIREIVPQIKEIVSDGLVTIEDCEILLYAHDEKKESG